MTVDHTIPTLDVYLESLAPYGTVTHQEQLLHRLDSLVEKNVIRDYHVHVWGSGIAHGTQGCHTPAGVHLTRRLITIQQWAVENDFDIDQVFPTREQTSPIDGRKRWVTRLPKIAIVERANDTIKFVSPSNGSNQRYSVEQHVDAIDPDVPITLVERRDATPVRDQVEKHGAMPTDPEEAAERRKQIIGLSETDLERDPSTEI